MHSDPTLKGGQTWTCPPHPQKTSENQNVYKRSDLHKQHKCVNRGRTRGRFFTEGGGHVHVCPPLPGWSDRDHPWHGGLGTENDCDYLPPADYHANRTQQENA